MRVKAVFFDLYGTLAYIEKPISDQQASEFLVSRGCEVYPQTFKAAWQYVAFVDYPKCGYKTWMSFLKQVMFRLDFEPDKDIVTKLARLYEEAEWKRYPEAEDAVTRAKGAYLKTAIVTSIARFKYEKCLKPVLGKIDLAVDAYTFHCEKSNPKIYIKTLENLKVRACEAVMIGDEMELDISLPKKLGMKAILLDRTGRTSSRDCREADGIVINLTEAIDVVTRTC
jgi:HAD superfamily hydrolase (TIGR01549 family)